MPTGSNRPAQTTTNIANAPMVGPFFFLIPKFSTAPRSHASHTSAEFQHPAKARNATFPANTMSWPRFTGPSLAAKRQTYVRMCPRRLRTERTAWPDMALGRRLVRMSDRTSASRAVTAAAAARGTPNDTRRLPRARHRRRRASAVWPARVRARHQRLEAVVRLAQPAEGRFGRRP